MTLLGKDIRLVGDLVGGEDLVIEGWMKGDVKLPHHSITIGTTGHVEANIYGRIIYVGGAVLGNLYADKQILIRASGRVRGDIVAPRVILEEGASFMGSIDIETSRIHIGSSIRS